MYVTTPTFALDGAVLAPNGRHLEPADTTSVPALRLEVFHLALLIEETGLVHGGLCGLCFKDKRG